MENLKCLHIRHYSEIDPTLLSCLKQLKEFHRKNRKNIAKLFQQIYRHNHAEQLKIFYFGLSLTIADRLAIKAFNFLLEEEIIDYLAKNQVATGQRDTVL